MRSSRTKKPAGDSLFAFSLIKNRSGRRDSGVDDQRAPTCGITAPLHHQAADNAILHYTKLPPGDIGTRCPPGRSCISMRSSSARPGWRNINTSTDFRSTASMEFSIGAKGYNCLWTPWKTLAWSSPSNHRTPFVRKSSIRSSS